MNTVKNAGLFRRIFAISYDSFLLAAILLVVFSIATSLNDNVAIESDDSYHLLYVILFFGICYLYFSWFWLHGGQSLGMKTWQIQLQTTNNTSLNHKIISIRFFSALFSWGCVGLGFLWALFDTKNRCWHDCLSNTELIDLRTRNTQSSDKE